MGNVWSSGVLLTQSLEEFVDRLYWPSVPYEGPVKLRFCCSACGGEAILLEPYPKLWKDIVGLRGSCFQCDGSKKIYTKFLEAGKERVAIWTFEGRDDKLLSSQLTKFIRAGPPTETQRLELDNEIIFQKELQPENFRANLLPTDFLFPEHGCNLSFTEKRKLFYDTVNKHVKTRESLKIKVERENLLEEAFKHFSSATSQQLRGSLTVNFIGEEATDWGGVSREFFQIVSEQLLDPRRNLFLPQGPNNTFHPSTSSHINDPNFEHFRFCGKLVGKSLLDKRFIKAPFTRAIFKLMLGKPLNFNDFQTIDKQTYCQLKESLEYDDDTLESCTFVFAVTTEVFGQKKTFPLKEGGEDLVVNRENIHEWIGLYSSWKMVDSVKDQLMNFLFGFYEVVPVQALSLFNEFELEQMICGSSEVDIENWKTHTVLVAFSSETKKRAEWFWEIIGEFDNQTRVQVLQFVTGSGQVPLSFEHLFPPFTIAFTRGLRDDSLPYGHTCFNRIDLPYYSSKEQMKKCLEKALEMGLVGFTFS
eukprot:TRINITY_DN11483_c0_g1_i1.p1 TRINITY_DN11483_c0_g1~~TRINITY_DN11483_c0_g1_i1.p1  ORF type:complete len:566 (-),score=107.19 TRINITY_DN11483_c0_g1_i1:48-1640(-)